MFRICIIFLIDFLPHFQKVFLSCLLVAVVVLSTCWEVESKTLVKRQEDADYFEFFDGDSDLDFIQYPSDTSEVIDDPGDGDTAYFDPNDSSDSDSI